MMQHEVDLNVGGTDAEAIAEPRKAENPPARPLPKGEFAWMDQIIARMDKLGDAMWEGIEAKFHTGLPNGSEWPDWALKLIPIFMTRTHEVRLKRGQKVRARQLGAVIGRQQALLGLCSGEIQFERKSFPPGWEQNLAKSPAGAALLRQARACMSGHGSFPRRSLFTQAVEEALALAAQQPHAEAEPFFKGFGEGIQFKPEKHLTGHWFALDDFIVLVMLMTWPTIEKMESVSELHRFLCEMFGPGAQITLGRIQKLCRRIGKRFKGRGRPRKAG